MLVYFIFKISKYFNFLYLWFDFLYNLTFFVMKNVFINNYKNVKYFSQSKITKKTGLQKCFGTFFGHFKNVQFSNLQKSFKKTCFLGCL